MELETRPILRLAVDLLKLPLISIAHVVPRLRPCRHWTYQQALRVYVARVLVQYIAIRQPILRLSNLPGEEGVRFELISPGSSGDYEGILRIDEAVHPEPVGATSYPSQRSETIEHSCVIIHFHGGAYVLGDGRESDAGFAARCLLEACKDRVTHVVCPQYRLASGPNGRFPAALQDAVTCYSHLVKRLNVQPAHIIVSGDSAGGNLALGLVRYLEIHGKEIGLAPPKHVWLWSPWLDPVSAVSDHVGHDRSVRAATDYTIGELALWSVRLLAPAPSTGQTSACEYLQFLGNAFLTTARMFVCAGGAEVFLDDNLLFAEQMRTVTGNQVEVFVIPNAPHDALLMGDKIGFETEARLGARAAAALLV